MSVWVCLCGWRSKANFDAVPQVLVETRPFVRIWEPQLRRDWFVSDPRDATVSCLLLELRVIMLSFALMLGLVCMLLKGVLCNWDHPPRPCNVLFKSNVHTMFNNLQR